MADIAISGFCDEVCQDKRLDRQLAVAAGLGLRFVALRFFDVGNGPKNILHATAVEMDAIRRMLDEHSMRVSSIGSPIGKVKLLDIDDGTANPFHEFEDYLATEVERICEIARLLEVRLIRGFSFYHPRGTDPIRFVPEVAGRLRRIAQRCDDHGLTFGLEVEANLVGQDGLLLAGLWEAVNHPALLLVFDGANLVTQGFSEAEIWSHWLAMKPHLGWLHVKDYRDPVAAERAANGVDEESLQNYVPVGMGGAGYRRILADLKSNLADVHRRLSGRDVGELFLDLEPHLRRGGQFGGYSGPDGFGIALRALTRLLDEVGLTYDLREWTDLFRPTPWLSNGT